MTCENNYSRRRWLRSCGVVGTIGVAGCLRLEEQVEVVGEAEDTSNSENRIELSPSWEHSTGFNVVVEDGDFFTYDGTVSRIRPDGTTIFETDEIEDEYLPSIAIDWREKPYVDESTVYMGFNAENQQGGRLYRIDSDTGQRELVFEEPADGFHDNIWAITRVDDLIVYASHSLANGRNEDIIIRAVDLTTENERWQLNISDGHVSNIVDLDDRLLIQGSQVEIYDIGSQENIGEWGRGGISRIKKDGDTLYAPRDSMDAIDSSTGDILWSTETDRSFNTDPAIGEMGVYCGTETGYLIAYDRETGDQMWERRVDGRLEQTPVVENNIVWVGDDRGGLTAYLAQTGEQYFSDEIEPLFQFDVKEDILLDTIRDTGFEIQIN